MTERQRAAAMAAGRHAGRAGLPVTKCPYDPAGNPTQRALASAWVREFLRQRPDAVASVDLGGDR